MTIDRRRFLTLGATGGAAALLLPGWLSRAFAQDRATRELTTNLATFSSAYRDAQRLGKPLLVLVVPTDDAQRWTRARAFGELLNVGPDAVLADLALAHVVCAEMTAVRALVPQAPAGEPTMLLVEPDRVPARATAIDVPSLEEAALVTAIHDALAPDTATLTERARVVRMHIDARTLASVEAAVRGASLAPHHPPSRLGGAATVFGDAATVDRAAAVLALAAQTAPSASAHVLRDSLAKAAIARLRLTRIPGSVWANDASCGIEIEGASEPNMMDCGMGSVSPRSARFLYFYTRPY